jgi:HlyD family secretion protein
MMKVKLLWLGALVVLGACSTRDDDGRVVGELASDRVELTAEFSEPITAIEVAEGAPVSVGDILLRQDNSRALARLADAEAFLQQARARMDELLRGPRREQIAAARASVEGATKDLQFRQSELGRIQEIHARGLASADALDQASAALDAASANAKLRRAQLQELLAGTTIEEIAQAEQAVQQAIARRDAVTIDIERLSLRSPVDGVVDSRLFELGERPGVGQPVIVVLGGTQPHARVYVPEPIRVNIGTGTKAVIHVDGLDAPLEGRVRWVSSEAAYTPYYALTERDRGRISFVAKVDIATTGDRLPDGVPVEVEFLPD